MVGGQGRVATGRCVTTPPNKHTNGAQRTEAAAAAAAVAVAVAPSLYLRSQTSLSACRHLTAPEPGQSAVTGADRSHLTEPCRRRGRETEQRAAGGGGGGGRAGRCGRQAGNTTGLEEAERASANDNSHVTWRAED